MNSSLVFAAPRPLQLSTWLPALALVLAICAESRNSMAFGQTELWLVQLTHLHDSEVANTLNILLRKGGHFTGYGLLGLGCARGWRSFLRHRIALSWSQLRLRAAALGVLSAAFVASADEIHQAFLPLRTGCVQDVLLDTAGAVAFNLLLHLVLSARRRALTGVPLITLNLQRVHPRQTYVQSRPLSCPALAAR